MQNKTDNCQNRGDQGDMITKYNMIFLTDPKTVISIKLSETEMKPEILTNALW